MLPRRDWITTSPAVSPSPRRWPLRVFLLLPTYWVLRDTIRLNVSDYVSLVVVPWAVLVLASWLLGRRIFDPQQSGLRLVLPEAAAISGVVVAPDGKPVASARVSYLPGLGGAFPSEAGTDREGRFLVWSPEGSSGNLVVNPTRWRDTFGRWDRTFDFTLENIAAGTKNLVVRLPKLP